MSKRSRGRFKATPLRQLLFLVTRTWRRERKSVPIRPYRPPSSPHPLHISTLSPGFGITVIHRFQDTKLFYFPRWVGLPPMGISPLVAYRPEHGFLTTSTLYGRMCHILHTCTLNSSSHSMYDTPVGLGLNAAARMNQRPACLVSFDVRSSLIWSCNLNQRLLARESYDDSYC